MNKLLGIAAVILVATFSVKADQVEVTVSGVFKSRTGDHTIPSIIDNYLGTIYEYSFIYDTDESGTYFDQSGTFFDWDEYSFNGITYENFHAELSSNLVITDPVPANSNVWATELEYGMINSSNIMTIEIGEVNTRSLALTFNVNVGIEDIVARSGDISGTTFHLVERFGNDEMGGTFEVVDIKKIDAASVPEPSTLVLLLSGFSILGFCFRRKS